MELKYFPTESIWTNILTKPLQGSKFKEMQGKLVNCPQDYHELTDTGHILPHTQHIMEYGSFHHAHIPLEWGIETNAMQKNSQHIT